MEIRLPFPLDSSLTLDLNSDGELAVPLSGPSSVSESFSASSSPYGPFTPVSRHSTPQKHDSACPQSVFFGMSPVPPYATRSLSPDYQPDMTRSDYLGTYDADSLTARQSVESVPTSMGYGKYAEMSMPQTYSTSGPEDPPAYDMYAMADRYRARPMNSPGSANTVCMSDMYNNEAYDFNSTMITRPPPTSMAELSGGDHFRGSDTEPISSPSVLSSLDNIPSPELPQRLSTVNFDDNAGDSRRVVPARRRNSMDEALMGLPDNDGEERIGVVEVRSIKSSENKCNVQGCNKSFNRKEHLKRHERATHENVKIECPFCQEKRDKPFNRWDNFKHHIKMHASRRNQGRVEFHPDAVAYYNHIMQNSRPRTRRRAVSEGRRASISRPRRGPSFVRRHRTM